MVSQEMRYRVGHLDDGDTTQECPGEPGCPRRTQYSPVHSKCINQQRSAGGCTGSSLICVIDNTEAAWEELACTSWHPRLS